MFGPSDSCADPIPSISHWNRQHPSETTRSDPLINYPDWRTLFKRPNPNKNSAFPRPSNHVSPSSNPPRLSSGRDGKRRWRLWNSERRSDRRRSRQCGLDARCRLCVVQFERFRSKVFSLCLVFFRLDGFFNEKGIFGTFFVLDFSGGILYGFIGSTHWIQTRFNVWKDMISPWPSARNRLQRGRVPYSNREMHLANVWPISLFAKLQDFKQEMLKQGEHASLGRWGCREMLSVMSPVLTNEAEFLWKENQGQLERRKKFAYFVNFHKLSRSCFNFCLSVWVVKAKTPEQLV